MSHTSSPLEQQTLAQLREVYPDILDILVDFGYDKLANQDFFQRIGKTLTLKTLCQTGKGNLDEILQVLEQRSTVKPLQIRGILPCPIRLPLLDKIEEFISQNNLTIDYTLPAASQGLDWLIEESKDPTALADIYLSAGFQLFFDPKAMGNYVKEGTFATYSHSYADDFHNAEFSMKDPKNIYTVLGVVPAIFLVNKTLLGDQAPPKSWKDLCSPLYEKSIAVPMKDLDLFNAVLLGIYSKYGEESVKLFGKNMVKDMHPAEMVKNASANPTPLISIAPYFFASMLSPEDELFPIWPEDGAIVSPIFLLCQEKSYEKGKPFLDFLSSQEMGTLFSFHGGFPSTVKGVDNHLSPQQKFLFCGFDFLYEHDIESLLTHLEQVFLGNETII